MDECVLADPETRISAGGIGEGEGEKEDSWDSSVRITKAQVQAQHEGNKLHLLLPKYQTLRYRNTHSLHLLRRALILRGGLSLPASLSNGSLSQRGLSFWEGLSFCEGSPAGPLLLTHEINWKWKWNVKCDVRCDVTSGTASATDIDLGCERYEKAKQRKRNKTIMWSIHISNLNTLVTKATELKLASFSCVFLLISVCRLFFLFVFVFCYCSASSSTADAAFASSSSTHNVKWLFWDALERALQLPKHLKFTYFLHLHLSISFSIYFCNYILVHK